MENVWKTYGERTDGELIGTLWSRGKSVRGGASEFWASAEVTITYIRYIRMSIQSPIDLIGLLYSSLREGE